MNVIRAVCVICMLGSAGMYTMAEAAAGTVHKKAITFSNGAKYEGEIKAGYFSGQGIYTWPNGERYEGEWKEGKQNGHGNYTWPDGNRYEGGFKDGLFSGYGIFTLANGERYEGDWKEGKKNGHGIYTWPDGLRYEGTWINGEPEGIEKYRQDKQFAEQFSVGDQVLVIQWHSDIRDVDYGYSGTVLAVEPPYVTLEVTGFYNVRSYVEDGPETGGVELYKARDVGKKIRIKAKYITGRGTIEPAASNGSSSGASESLQYVSVSAADWIEVFSSNWAVKRLELQNINGYQNQESPGYIINGENNTTITSSNGGAIAGKYRWTATWSNGDEQRTYSGVIYVSGSKANYRIRLREDGSDAGSGEY